MNASLMTIEIVVLLLGLGLLLLDLWTAPERKRLLGYGAAAALGLVLLYSLRLDATTAQVAFGGSYVLDGLALFFKRFFLLAAILVLLLAVEFSDRIAAGIAEYYSLVVFALAGMLFAASAADFTLLFVAIELITITFYVLTSFQRGLRSSLEAGVKYLVMGGIASAFMVYGVALVYGTSGTMNFAELAVRSGSQTGAVFHLGLLLVFLGLGFKIAAFPLHIW
ncbi:MAG TPA: proton-conducting transporter membrane subunit, partial [Methylomirabilota bacterium]|nr:proton-conducting transporter membrane subunit [Methylomirabilota bacterium]